MPSEGTSKSGRVGLYCGNGERKRHGFSDSVCGGWRFENNGATTDVEMEVWALRGPSGSRTSVVGVIKKNSTPIRSTG